MRKVGHDDRLELGEQRFEGPTRFGQGFGHQGAQRVAVDLRVHRSLLDRP
jgi:hypothetical protein